MKILDSNRRITSTEIKEASTLIIEEKECNIFNGEQIKINAAGMIGGRGVGDGLTIFGSSANKIDNEPERKVSKEQGEKLAKEFDIAFFETSAKTGVGINESVFYLVQKIIETDPEVKKRGKNLKIGNKKRKCC